MTDYQESMTIKTDLFVCLSFNCYFLNLKPAINHVYFFTSIWTTNDPSPSSRKETSWSIQNIRISIQLMVSGQVIGSFFAFEMATEYSFSHLDIYVSKEFWIGCGKKQLLQHCSLVEKCQKIHTQKNSMQKCNSCWQNSSKYNIIW